MSENLPSIYTIDYVGLINRTSTLQKSPVFIGALRYVTLKILAIWNSDTQIPKDLIVAGLAGLPGPKFSTSREAQTVDLSNKDQLANQLARTLVSNLCAMNIKCYYQDPTTGAKRLINAELEIKTTYTNSSNLKLSVLNIIINRL